MAETLADIGEFGLINRIKILIQQEGIQSPDVTVGLGDDTASFQPHPGYEILATCDCSVEGRHFLPGYIEPRDLGRRAMVMNISDIGAMGGRPLYALISLGLRAETPVEEVEEIYRGFLAELSPFGASIIGGNITKAQSTPFIDIMLIGEVEEGKTVRRTTAKPGNAILVTGYPGQAGAGIELLLEAGPTEDLRNHPLVRAFNTPTHRAVEGQAAARSGYATAMIDTSDGFLGDLGHILEESRVGAELVREKLPISQSLLKTAARMSRDPCEFFLRESDDYELIITCPPEHVKEVREAVAEVSDVVITEVGRITDSPNEILLVQPDGSHRRLSLKGWDHFSV